MHVLSIENAYGVIRCYVSCLHLINEPDMSKGRLCRENCGNTMIVEGLGTCVARPSARNGIVCV